MPCEEMVCNGQGRKTDFMLMELEKKWTLQNYYTKDFKWLHKKWQNVLKGKQMHFEKCL